MHAKIKMKIYSSCSLSWNMDLKGIPDRLYLIRHILHRTHGMHCINKPVQNNTVLYVEKTTDSPGKTPDRIDSFSQSSC
jgi:hypothetical protein